MRILVVSLTNQGGVPYYRQHQPHIVLQEVYGDKVQVEITDRIDLNDEAKLKNYNIIQFHRTAVPFNQMDRFFNVTKKLGIKTVMDIDDYWVVNKNHQVHAVQQQIDPKNQTLDNVKRADIVTTTTPYFANILRKYNKNVFVIENGISKNDKQFSANKKPYNRTRYGFVTGSSHKHDLDSIKDLFQYHKSDNVLSEKSTIVLCGFDLRGETIYYDYITNEFHQDCLSLGVWSQKLHQDIMKFGGDLRRISYLPKELVNKYKILRPYPAKRPITPDETVWTHYERLLTSNYSIISQEYKQQLMLYQDRDFAQVDKNLPYLRYFTRDIVNYGKHYENLEISLAPLEYTEFNKCKSELKMIEAGFTKTAIIVSDIETYNGVAKNGVNCLTVKENRKHKDWYKSVKKLITEPSMREDLTNALHEEIVSKYTLEGDLTHKRYNIYLDLVNGKI